MARLPDLNEILVEMGLPTLEALASENEHLRETVRVAEAVRDDARAHSQRLLDENRALRERVKDLEDNEGNERC